MRTNRLLAIASSLLLVAGSSSCVAVAVGAGLGFMVSQEFTNNQKLVYRYKLDVEDVWATAQSVMNDICEGPPEVIEFPRTLKGTYMSADVTMTVIAHDHLQTDVTIEAREYGSRSGLTSKRVHELLEARLAQR